MLHSIQLILFVRFLYRVLVTNLFCDELKENFTQMSVYENWRFHKHLVWNHAYHEFLPVIRENFI